MMTPGVLHPLTLIAPAVSPLTKYLCRRTKTVNTGTMAINEPAKTRPQSEACVPWKLAMAMGKVRFKGSLIVVNAQTYSSQAPRKVKIADGRQSWCGQGQQDAEENGQVGASVNQCGFLQLAGQLFKEASQQKGVESNAARCVCEDQTGQGIQQLESGGEHELRNDQHHARYHQRGQQGIVQHVLSGKLEASKSISNCGGKEDLQNGGDQRNLHAVEKVTSEVIGTPGRQKVVPRGVRRYKARGKLKDIHLSLLERWRSCR